MKLTVSSEDNRVVLRVLTTGNEVETLYLPTKNVEYWYPFNVNFSYRYSDAKGYLYLVKERDYHGENKYNVDVLKRTKPLDTRDGIMFHPYVYKENREVIKRARQLGLPTIKDVYFLEDVQAGFEDLAVLIHTVKNRIEDRIIKETGNKLFNQSLDDYDNIVYNNAEEKELGVLKEFGEIYSMLTVMRKLAERG